MRIVRNGKSIELTQEELYEAYRTQQLNRYRGDLKIAIQSAKKKGRIPSSIEWLVDVEDMIYDYDDEMDDNHWRKVAYRVVIDHVESLIEEYGS